MTAEEVEANLGTRRVGASALCFREVDSTNDVAWGSMRGGRCDGLVILADSQRFGRGRHGRSWQSAPGVGLLMSVLLEDDDRRLSPEAVTVASGLAVAEGVERAAGVRCELKWPNDVLADGAKLAGVLVEARSVEGRRGLVVGIGVNVLSSPPGEQVARPATCLADHLPPEGRDPSLRVAVARAILQRLDEHVADIDAGRLEGLHAGWMRRCGMIGERTTVVCAGVSHTGRVVDVSPLEGIELVTDDGLRIHLPAATSTVTV